MKKFNLNSRSARHGGVAFAITAIVVAIVVVLNLIVGQLPSSVLEYDISNQQLYTMTAETKGFIKELDKDIHIVIVSDDASMDQRISKFVDKYASMSDRITTEQVDPVMYPSVLETYGCNADSVVVTCPETGKLDIIPIHDYSNAMITYEMDYNTYSYNESAFDAEGQITSAIKYVTTAATSTAVAITGHGETKLSTSVSDMLAKANISVTDEYNLLMDGGLSEDCAVLVCNNPKSDLADDELTAIRAYLANGGDMILICEDATLPNFNALMKEYGMSIRPGFVGDTQLYYSQYAQYYGYFCMAPSLTTSDVNEGINANAMLLYPRTLDNVAAARNTIKVDPLMVTSTGGLYFENENDEGTSGQYIISAMASEETENGTANLTVIASASMIDASITDSFTSMSNVNIFMNIVTKDLSALGAVSIPSKSLSVTYNTFSNYVVWALIFVIIIPAACIVCGLAVWLSRRKR